jgi:hypothetical protein
MRDGKLGVMARGWESKAVESQREEREQAVKPAAPLAAGEAARRTERATLLLARTQALSQLQQACAPAYRAMLEQAIADLDRRLADIDAASSRLPAAGKG